MKFYTPYNFLLVWWAWFVVSKGVSGENSHFLFSNSWPLERIGSLERHCGGPTFIPFYPAKWRTRRVGKSWGNLAC